MVLNETLLFLFLTVSPVALLCVQRKDSIEEQNVLREEINKLKDDSKKKQEEARKLVDEIVAQIEHSCGANAGCPSGWVKHGHSCYYIDDTPTLEQSHARTRCKSMGGDLAIIGSSGEDQFILDLITKQKTVPQLGAWLGFKRNDADSKLYWIDGTPLEGSRHYHHWASGEPNNGGNVEDCGNMYGTPGNRNVSPGTWNDVRCDLTTWGRWAVNNAPVILCEKPI